MSWLKHNQKAVGHKCPLPAPIFHSTVKITPKSKWQCPECLRVYTIATNWYGKVEDRYFKEHKLGANNFWYYIEFEDLDYDE